MCGLTGFFRKQLLPESTLVDQLQQMVSTLYHRGPDSEGIWVDGARGIALAHRRLAIQDLSPLGHQPMQSHDGRYVIVFNGEIYNFPDLRRELEARGRTFRGHSDTEIMLESFSEWGVVPALQKFSGMFAFALWDRQALKLYLARDRAGEKPLYYGWQGSTFLFGSELKALRKHPEWDGRIDRDALSLYCKHNFIPAPWSIFTGIYKLPPGCFLVLDGQSGQIETQLYWSLREVYQDGIANPLTASPEDIADMLEVELRAVIDRQLIADVPVGAFLSGGIDSSTIVALMQSTGSSRVKTFTIGFGEQAYNEAHHARDISAHLQTEHTELYVSPDEAREVIPGLPEIYDEPFADSSQIPTFLVARLARQKVTVSLSGDGGDELFCGYSRYFQTQRHLQALQRYPSALSRTAARALLAVPKPLLDYAVGTGIRITGRGNYHDAGERIHQRVAGWLYHDLQLAYRHRISYLRNDQIVVGGRELPYALNDEAQALQRGTLMQQMQYLDMMCYLPDDILVKVDRAAMANSLETRIPLLDKGIIELAARIPTSVNLLHADGKWPLRRILSKYVPAHLTERPKQGFAVPVAEWLRGPLHDWAADLIDPAQLKEQGYFDVKRVQRQWLQHTQNQQDCSFSLWGIIGFQAWLQAWQKK